MADTRTLHVTSTGSRTDTSVRWGGATSGHWDRIVCDRWPRSHQEWEWVAQSLLARLVPDGAVTMPGRPEPLLSPDLLALYFGTPQAMAAPVLTDDEHHAVELCGQLWDHLARNVVADGESRNSDLAELCGHVHAVQRAVLAQAAARAYPARYRLLGDTLPRAT